MYQLCINSHLISAINICLDVALTSIAPEVPLPAFLYVTKFSRFKDISLIHNEIYDDYWVAAAAVPEWCLLENVIERSSCVHSVLDAKLFERRVDGDEGRDDDVVEHFQQQVQHALTELHAVGEGRYGDRQVGRQPRVWVELAKSGGDEGDEGCAKVVGQNTTARIKCLDY